MPRNSEEYKRVYWELRPVVKAALGAHDGWTIDDQVIDPSRCTFIWRESRHIKAITPYHVVLPDPPPRVAERPPKRERKANVDEAEVAEWLSYLRPDVKGQNAIRRNIGWALASAGLRDLWYSWSAGLMHKTTKLDTEAARESGKIYDRRPAECVITLGYVRKLALTAGMPKPPGKAKTKAKKGGLGEVLSGIIDDMAARPNHISLSDGSYWIRSASGWTEITTAQIRQDARGQIEQETEGGRASTFQVNQVVSAVQDCWLPTGVQAVQERHGPKMERHAIWDLETGAELTGLLLADKAIAVTDEGEIVTTDWDPDHTFTRHISPLTWHEGCLNEAPLWESMIAHAVPDDDEAEYLEAMLGLHLLGQTKWELMTILQGAPRTGKSTVLRIWDSLIPGSQYISGGIAGLGGRFGASKMAGARYCWFDELHDPKRSKTSPAMVEGQATLKSGISGAVHSVEMKHGRHPVNLVTFPTFAGNSNFDLDFAGGALDYKAWERRLIVFKFMHPIADKDIKENLAERIIATEGAAVIVRAIQAYAHIVARGGFTRVRPEGLVQNTKDTLQASMSVYARLVDSTYVRDPDGFLLNTNIDDTARAALFKIDEDATYNKRTLRDWLQKVFGAKASRHMAGRGWKGIALAESVPEPSELGESW